MSEGDTRLPSIRDMIGILDSTIENALCMVSQARTDGERKWWRGIADELLESQLHMRRAEYRARQYP